ncbi:DesA family fatty acid desaturase [Arenimonas caeni]|jgi:stearoyl-CoA desaturase (delta-9 desaturase)|uniref:Acyl-CoA desaturase n=1 Tax=Arenimonas caeni TaxID=2058085 RepID=A0A2P6M965_9GAMM|nr:acyl-CoA desaturase [Arenimonas caeni]
MSPELYDWLARGLTQASYWQMAAFFLVMVQTTIFTVTLYLHRSAAHRGVDFHPVITHFFRFWAWLTTAMVTKEWTAVHRKHHAKCETAEDPHSPRFHGINRVLWRGVELFQSARNDKEMLEKYGKGSPDDWIERNLYSRMPTMGPVTMLAIDLALFGIPGVAIWALQMAWIPFWAAGVINGLGHWWGYRNFDTADTATNLTPWAFWVGGEELHNNHHAFPSSAKFALRKYEFDIGWAVIRVLEKLRLAKVLRVAPELDVRPNIQVPDADTLRAMMAHRWQVATDYYKFVLKPHLQAEAADLPGRLRRAFRSEGKWLGEEQRAKFSAWIAERPQTAQLMEFRARLLAIYEVRSAEAEAKMEALRVWCAEAEASGIRQLQEFSERLKGYSMAPARA